MKITFVNDVNNEILNFKTHSAFLVDDTIFKGDNKTYKVITVSIDFRFSKIHVYLKEIS